MIKRWLFLIAVVLMLHIGNSSVVLAQEFSGLEAGIEMSDGSQLEGILLSINTDAATFNIDGNEKTLSVKSISQIRFADRAEGLSETSNIVALVDRSKLICQSLRLTDRKLQATTENGVEFKLNSRLIDFVRFGGGDPALEVLWREAVERVRESDALIVVRDQKLQSIDGIIGEVSAEAVLFTAGERTAEVKLDRLSGMLFYRRVTDEFAPAQCIMQFSDGSTIHVRSIAIKDQAFEVNSVAGISVSVALDSVASIDFGANRSVWLTDLDSATNDWTPLIANPTILASLKQFSVARMDRSFSGKALAILTYDEDSQSGSEHRQEFSKGFAIKGGGKLSFLLAKQYRRLTGLISFDPEANATGKVKFIVQIDGKNRIEEILDASNMRRPFDVDIDLSGADRIVFQVDYHDRRSVGDILHAVDMKLDR